MGAQFIRTEKGEELVVLSRRDYDAMLASLGDEEAEDRMTAIIIDEARARQASGEDPPPMPSEIVYPMLDGVSPLRAVRDFYRRTIEDLAKVTDLERGEVVAIDDASRAPTADEARRLAEALGVDPRWLEPL